jgi:hypothetical protein
MADRFWVGGSGNWSSTGHWSATSGGAGGASVPTNADNAVFDAASNATAYSVTVDVVAPCLNLQFAAAPSVSGTITLLGNATISVFGNVTLLAGMVLTWNGLFNLASTAVGRTITCNGVAFQGNVTFNGVGGEWTLQDTLSNSGFTITLTNGNVVLNGQTVNCGAWSLTTATVSAAGSTINAFFFAGGSKSYGTVQVKSTNQGGGTLSGVNTFQNLTLFGDNTTSTRNISLSANQTVSGTLKYIGGSVVNRLLVFSDVLGTARTITAAAVDAASDFVDFRDITAAGAAVPFAGANTRVGNCLGNTNITFTPAVNRFWRGGSGNFSDTAHWATISGGVGGASVPIPQDTAFFDANSFAGGSTTASFDLVRICSINATGANLTPLFNRTAGSLEFYGTTYIFGNGVTLGSFNPSFLSRSATSITMGTTATLTGLTLTGPGATFTLQDAFNLPGNGGINVGTGTTLNTNGVTVTLGTTAGSGTFLVNNGATLILGASTIIIATDSSNNLDVRATATITPGTSTIKFTSGRALQVGFAGAGKTYNNIWHAATGNLALVDGANVFNNLKLDAGKTILFTAATTTTITSLTVGAGTTIGSLTAASHTLAKAGGGTVVVDGVTISRSTASPASTFFAGATAVNGGNNVNWTFATVASRVGSAAGSSTVNGVANKIVGRTGTAAGIATVSGIANKIVGRVGSAVGTSAAIGDSQMIQARVGTANGSSTCVGEHRLTATMTPPVERFIKPEPQDRSYRV